MNGRECGTYTIVSQLIWREFFYCMSANNPFYAEMDRNPICIDIPWYDIPDQLAAFEDRVAGVKQREGHVHARDLVGDADLLTLLGARIRAARGDL